MYVVRRMYVCTHSATMLAQVATVSKAFGAMVYPAFLLFISWVTIFILVSFVFPKFVVIFNDFDASLPIITQIVINISAFMGKFWWAVLITGAMRGNIVSKGFLYFQSAFHFIKGNSRPCQVESNI